MKHIHYLRYLVGGILLVAGLLKIPNLFEFYASVARYEFISVIFGNYISFAIRVLVLFEILLGVVLITGHWRKTALASASIVIIFFLGLSIYDYLIGNENGCGCFGGIEVLESSSEWRVVQNFVIFLMLIGLLKYDNSPPINSKNTRLFVSITYIILLFLFISARYSINNTIEYLHLKDSDMLQAIVQNQLISNGNLYFQDKHGNTYSFDELVHEANMSLILLYNPVRCIECLSDINDLYVMIERYFVRDIRFISISMDNTNLQEFSQLIKIHRFDETRSFIMQNDSYFRERLTTPLLILMKSNTILSNSTLHRNSFKQQEIFYNILYEISNNC